MLHYIYPYDSYYKDNNDILFSPNNYQIKKYKVTRIMKFTELRVSTKSNKKSVVMYQCELTNE